MALNLTNEFEPIRNWAKERNLYEKGDVKTQLIKLLEEQGELARAILKNDREEFIDAIGDCVVVLTNLTELGNKYFTENCKTCKGEGGYYEDVAGDGGSRQWIGCDCSEHISLESCTNSAYEVIASRTGKMIGGTFVKDK